MKVGEVLRMLQEDGWELVATRGSHRQYKHPGVVDHPHSVGLHGPYWFHAMPARSSEKGIDDPYATIALRRTHVLGIHDVAFASAGGGDDCAVPI